MSEITIKIPGELESEFKSVSKIDWQILVGRRLNKELEKLAEIKRIVSKSKLTEKDAEELSDKINLSLARRYERLLKEGE